MKKKSILISLIVLFLCVSCKSLEPVPLAYRSNEEIDVAYISFVLNDKYSYDGVTYVTYDDKDTPEPEKNTYWTPVEVPAGKPITLVIHCKYEQEKTECDDESIAGACLQGFINAFEATRDVDIDVLFDVPPLEPYEDYEITYTKGPGIPGKSYVILRNKKTNEEIREMVFN